VYRFGAPSRLPLLDRSAVSGGLGGPAYMLDLCVLGRGDVAFEARGESIGLGERTVIFGGKMFSLVADSLECAFEKEGYGRDSLFSKGGLLTTRRLVSEEDILVFTGETKGWAEDDDDFLYGSLFLSVEDRLGNGLLPEKISLARSLGLRLLSRCRCFSSSLSLVRRPGSGLMLLGLTGIVRHGMEDFV